VKREEQKEIREMKKLLPVEIRKQRKLFNFQYAYGFLYRFEGDFLYQAIVDVSSSQVDVIKFATLIKPWILNETYWEIQQMDMEEMRSKPKSLHVNGAFTINDIYFDSSSLAYDKNDFGNSIHEVLCRFDAEISNHKKRLTSISELIKGIEGYKVSNLTKAIGLIYEGDYEKARDMLLLPESEGDVYKHTILRNGKGISARDLALDYCQRKLSN
jgi:hypothetical protein